MKIAGQTSDQMVLQDSNYWGIFFAVVLVVVSLFFSFGSGSGNSILNDIIYWLIVLIVGVAIIFVNPSFTITINKSDGTLLFHLKRIALPKTRTYQIADIARIELRKIYRNTSKGTQAVTQSVIILKNGKEVPLEGKKVEGALGAGLIMGGNSAKEDKELSIAQQAATFMNVPFQEISPGNNSPGIELPGGIQL